MTLRVLVWSLSAVIAVGNTIVVAEGQQPTGNQTRPQGGPNPPAPDPNSSPTAGGPGCTSSVRNEDDEFSKRATKLGPGITNPVALKQVNPTYTSAALRAKVQGSVELEMIVLADGTAGDVRVVKCLDQTYGLDDQAVAAARKWVFKPSTRDGIAIPVFVTLVLEFRIAR